ncbi:hypothetical protein WM23_22360 [Burkholderia ubonensis]|nr:hypothetical protein WM23_22360 [Burkholderia ubonensis]
MGQYEPLLGIHRLRFVGRDGEKVRIEPVQFIDVAARRRQAMLRQLFGQRGTIHGHRPDGRLVAANALPKCL